MKYVMVIIDGVSDDPIRELGGKTPLEVASTPFIDQLVSNGKVGCINTAIEGYPIESLACIMGLLGYNPRRYYPNGRASFEALAKGIDLSNDDLVLRCNLIKIDEKDNRIVDFTGGLISDIKAKRVISKIKLPYKNWEIHAGQSYRNTLIIRNAKVNPQTIKCFEPHMNIGNKVVDILPRSIRGHKNEMVDKISDFLINSYEQIANISNYDCCANMLWVWSPSKKPEWPTFKHLNGLDAACVGGLDFFHGMAKAADMHYEVVPGATGYIDTDYNAKANYAIKYINDFDFVLIHINATDEEAHQHNFNGKKEAIEKIDKNIIGKLINHLNQSFKDEYRILVCGDHKTRCIDGKHIGDPVPYVIFGKDISRNVKKADTFSEKLCLKYEPVDSLLFLQKEMFIK